MCIEILTFRYHNYIYKTYSDYIPRVINYYSRYSNFHSQSNRVIKHDLTERRTLAEDSGDDKK